jgi:hypothetical protein
MAKPKTPAPPVLVPTQFRFPSDLLEQLDQWVVELNEGRGWPQLTRADVVRGVLQWAVQEKPDWEAKKGRAK